MQRRGLVARSVQCTKLYTCKSLSLFPKTADYSYNRNFHILTEHWKFPDRCELEPVRELKISEYAPVHSFAHGFL